MSIDVVEVVIWRESSVSGGSGAVQMFLRWPSGYDVDGTDQTSLGQFSGRVQQTYKHSVPRFFVPEHGTMFTLALVRFPPTATKEIQYLNAKGALTYTDIA